VASVMQLALQQAARRDDNQMTRIRYAQIQHELVLAPQRILGRPWYGFRGGRFNRSMYLGSSNGAS